jgi:hypothetical protein
MRDRNILNLTADDRAAIAKYRRTMIAAVALIVAVTLGGADLHRRFLAPLLSVDVASAESQNPVISRECAQRDAEYIFQIEEQGHRPGASGAKLYEAHTAMLEARTLCQAGRQKEALALYDNAFGAFVAPRDVVRTRGSVAQGSAD